MTRIRRSLIQIAFGLSAVALSAILPSAVGNGEFSLYRPLSSVKRWLEPARREVAALAASIGTWHLSREGAPASPSDIASPDPAFADAGLTGPLGLGDPVVALGIEPAGLREAVSFYKAGDLVAGDNVAKNIADPLVRTTLEWVALRSVGPQAVGYERLSAFQQINPGWPNATWMKRRIEEALLGDRRGPLFVKEMLVAAPPETVIGKLALARLLDQDGKTPEAAGLVRKLWREADLPPALETKITTDFGRFLEKADFKYRADRLLYKEQLPAALRTAAAAGPEVVALAKARAAVVAQAANDKIFAAVPAAMQADPGFLYSRIQYLRRADRIVEAATLMLGAPRDPARLISGDDWWVERRLIARKMLDRGDAETAYWLCAQHSAQSPESKIEAEFHAGWIALRFTGDAQRAAGHFATLSSLAETPMSAARAFYWQGRAAEALEANEAARDFYEKAASRSANYYGQLARKKLGLPEVPLRKPADEAEGAARLLPIRVVELLYTLGERDLAQPLALETARCLSDGPQAAALAGIVARQYDAHAALAVGKQLAQRGFAVDNLAFPTYGIPAYQPLPNSVDGAVVYSVARQESAFDTKAASGVGAKGLMQMMTATAKTTAERARIPFDEGRLISDPSFNAQLGAAHLGELLNEQGGSFPLVFAAYNAGGGRVKQWIQAYGDPRGPGVDEVDWIERIPFTETRNYVQRVMENLALYKARFGIKHGDLRLRTQAKL